MCRGEPLAEAAALFRQSEDRGDRVNLAVALWAQEHDEECRNLLQTIDVNLLPVDAADEVTALRSLVTGQPKDSGVSLVRDPTLLRAVWRHPDLPDQRRPIVASFLPIDAFGATNVAAT